jgi:hypothetical protein
MLSATPERALEGIGAAAENHDERIRDAACRIFTDRNIRPDLRAAAIEPAAKNKDRKSLLSSCGALNDTSPAYRAEYMPPVQGGISIRRTDRA